MFSFFTNLTYNLNYYISIEIYDLLKLIDVIDITSILDFYGHSDYTTIPARKHRILIIEKIFLPQPIHFKELKLIFLNQLFDLNFFSKIFILLNIFLIKIFFLQITPTTFWFLPTILSLVFGLILLFLIKPTESGKKNWILAK